MSRERVTVRGHDDDIVPTAREAKVHDEQVYCTLIRLRLFSHIIKHSQILKADGLGEVHRAQDSLQYITDIKFSPNGEVLAVASHDGSVYHARQATQPGTRANDGHKPLAASA